MKEVAMRATDTRITHALEKAAATTPDRLEEMDKLVSP